MHPRCRRQTRRMRVAVIGPSGSGKMWVSERLASRLGLRHVEVDALYHGPNWEQCTLESCATGVRGGDVVGSALGQVATPPDHKNDQQHHDSHNADDVRHAGKGTRDVARIRPDESDDRSADEQRDHRSKPPVDTSICDHAAP